MERPAGDAPLVESRPSVETQSDGFMLSQHRIIGLGPNDPPVKLSFYHVDHLGTPRVIIDVSGNLVSRHKYLPFGEELSAPPSTNSHKFTGHERDTETGLDYMLARYFGQGTTMRFLSTDPGEDTSSDVPQSWNKYTYVRNNPVNANDPTGQWVETGFDVGMATISVAQAYKEPSLGNIVGAVLDVAAVALPFVPAVAGRVIDAAQAGNKIVDAVQTANKVDNVADAGKAAGAAADYSKIPDPATGVKAGGDFTARQKAGAMEANRQANGGVLKSDKSGTELVPAKQSRSGEPHNPNEAHVDHKDSKKNGGTNGSANIQILSRKENLKKGAESE